MTWRQGMDSRTLFRVRTHSWHLLQNWKRPYFTNQKSEAQHHTHPVHSENMGRVSVVESPTNPSNHRPSLLGGSIFLEYDSSSTKWLNWHIFPKTVAKWAPWCFPVLNPAVPIPWTPYCVCCGGGSTIWDSYRQNCMSDRVGFEFWLCHLLAMWLGYVYTSQSFSLLICKTRITIPIS